MVNNGIGKEVWRDGAILFQEVRVLKKGVLEEATGHPEEAGHVNTREKTVLHGVN